MKYLLLLLLLLVLLSACGGGSVAITATQTGNPDPLPETDMPVATISPTVTSIAIPTSTLAPDAWMRIPVVPAGVSQRVIEIYRHGQELGNNPRAFSKIGDCDATPTWFLGDFDLSPDHYSIGNYSDLQPVIEFFHGSFARQGLAVSRGFTAASVLTPLWNDEKQCQVSETPLACEVRLHRPSFAFILLGTNDVYHQEVFETNMHRILDYLVENGVVPILATKADNLEGDHSINATIDRLAYSYDVPLWNFWLKVQDLPDRGLQLDKSHLTWDSNYFDNPARMQAAWPWRNLTALQVLDVVWKGVSEQP